MKQRLGIQQLRDAMHYTWNSSRAAWGWIDSSNNKYVGSTSLAHNGGWEASWMKYKVYALRLNGSMFRGYAKGLWMIATQQCVYALGKSHT